MCLKNSILLLIFTMFLSMLSCNRRSEEKVSRIGLVTDRLQLNLIDSILIDGGNMSLSGNWVTDGKDLFYRDNNIVSIKVFTPRGEIKQRLFTRGRGPKELISPPIALKVLNDREYLYVDHNSCFYLFDSVLNILKSFNFYQHGRQKDLIFKQRLYDNPDPKEILMYELSSNENQIEEFGGKIIFPITTEHIKYNGYYRNAEAKKFYRESFTLMAIKETDFTVDTIFAKFPSVYHKKILPNFKDCYITKSDSLLFVAYEADYKIYEFNLNLELLSAFGVKSQYINSDYPERNTFEDAESHYKEDRISHGYYSKISYINKYLFRIYHTKDNKLGMQIYSGSDLLYDRFLSYDICEMIGYISPYYYANIKCDIENEKYTIVKFQIKNER
jgi:hypothetical protein